LCVRLWPGGGAGENAKQLGQGFLVKEEKSKCVLQPATRGRSVRNQKMAEFVVCGVAYTNHMISFLRSPQLRY